jgi:hypothetical protein
MAENQEPPNLRFLQHLSGRIKMNPLYSIQKELYEAWLEATHPLFPASSSNDYFDTKLFEYYQSRKGKIIDTHNGESLFSAATANAYSADNGHLHINKTQSWNLSVASSFQAGNWKPA